MMKLSFVIDRLVRRLRPFAIAKPGLTLAVLLVGLLAPRIAAATQSAELYRTQAYFYGRFEARVRFAPGEGVVSSFFLWKEGSSSTTTWNELDFEKINSDCRLQTNIWTGKGTQNATINTPTFNICNDYHTYAFEWTPDYIAWLIDGTQIRKITGANVTEYTQNASAGMDMHFNIWAGDSSFGGNLAAATLPVHQYISWAQYSSYANGAFQLQWREDFNGSAVPSGWATGNWVSPLNHSMHNPANVTFGNGVAVLSMTSDTAPGFTGTPPADPASTGGTSGTGGTPATGGTTGTGGTPATGGTKGTGGTSGMAGATGHGGTPGTGGSSATGGATGTGGTSATGGAPGTGGTSMTGGTTGNGGASATGGGTGTGGTSGPSGAGGDPSVTGTGGTGTGSGQAGSSGQTGGDSGCACDVSAARGSQATAAFLLLALALGARRRRAS